MMKQLAIGIAAVFITAAAAQARCPIVGLREIALEEGFLPDPNVQDVTNHYDVDLTKCADFKDLRPSPTGWVTLRPDYVVRYKTRGSERSKVDLTFRMESTKDTVLLIQQPDGQWRFDDDGGGKGNPRILFEKAPAGRYDIWIGNYNKGEPPPLGKLLISEREKKK